jgi:hypothetical protein
MAIEEGTEIVWLYGFWVGSRTVYASEFSEVTTGGNLARVFLEGHAAGTLWLADTANDFVATRSLDEQRLVWDAKSDAERRTLFAEYTGDSPPAEPTLAEKLAAHDLVLTADRAAVFTAEKRVTENSVRAIADIIRNSFADAAYLLVDNYGIVDGRWDLGSISILDAQGTELANRRQDDQQHLFTSLLPYIDGIADHPLVDGSRLHPDLGIGFSVAYEWTVEGIRTVAGPQA